MKGQRTNLSNLNEFRLALLVAIVGSAAMLVSLISYYLATSNVIVNTVTDEQLQAPAMATLTAYLLGLVSIIYGLNILIHQEWRRQEVDDGRWDSCFYILGR